MLGLRSVTVWANETAPVCTPSDVVAITVSSVEEVPYAKPDWLELEPPILPIKAFSMAVEVDIEDAAIVETVDDEYSIQYPAAVSPATTEYPASVICTLSVA